jgi:hypothetical protein
MKNKMSNDAKVVNYAPDSDCLAIHLAGWKIVIDRDEDGSVNVVLHDTIEGSSTFYTLGETDETQKL